jgi:hypothetical protein
MTTPALSDSTRRPPAGRVERVARAAAFTLLDQITGGEVTVVESGARHRFGQLTPDRFGRAPLSATIHVHHPGVYRRVLTSGSVGLGESYADGWWDTDDLAALLRVLDRNVRRTDRARRTARRLTAPVTDPVRRLRRQDRRRDKDDIRSHYDLGNDFFERLLDESMMYSSAIFPTADATLLEGSIHKLDTLCERIDLRPEDHVLEIGTGWEFGQHYAETLRRWRHNLRSCRSELVSLGLDERFGRLWDFYLAYCEAGFDERDITVVQLVLAGPGWTRRTLPIFEETGPEDRIPTSPILTSA